MVTRRVLAVVTASAITVAVALSTSAAAGAAVPAKASPIVVVKTGLGSVLATSAGRTVYVLTADPANTSTCTGACVTSWPPVLAPAGSPTKVPGVTGTFGVITRPDGARQLTLNSMPLYTYAGDTAKGTTAGQGLPGTWYVVGKNGRPVTKPPIGQANVSDGDEGNGGR